MMTITMVLAVKSLTKMMTVTMKIPMNKLTKMMKITTTTAWKTMMTTTHNTVIRNAFFCPQVINMSIIFHSQHEQQQENVQLTLHSLCQKTVGNVSGDEGLSVIGTRIHSIDYFHNDNGVKRKFISLSIS